MLQGLSDKVVDCLQHAAECRRIAEASTDKRIRSEFMDMEQRWLKLSESHQLTERLSGWIAETACRRSAD